MGYVMFVGIIALAIALICVIVAYWSAIWAAILAVLAGIIAIGVGGLVFAGVRALFTRDISDFKAKDWCLCACSALGTLGFEILFGFLSWIWPISAVCISTLLWLLFYFMMENERWPGVGKVGIRAIAYVFWGVVVFPIEWSVRKLPKAFCWLRQVIKHGGVGKYREALVAKQEKIEREAREREEARQRQVEEERTRQEEEEKARIAHVEELVRIERERIAKEEAIRKDKESRALSELDEMNLKVLANERLSVIDAKVKAHNRSEFAEIVRVDPSAFNDYDSPYARIEAKVRVFGVTKTISVVFSLVRVIKSCVDDTEIAGHEWRDFETGLEKFFDLAKAEFEIFADADDAARLKRYSCEDAVLARRRSMLVEIPKRDEGRWLDAFDELELTALAFRRMQDINVLLAEYKAPVRADFSSVCVDASYGNTRGLPFAEINIGLPLCDKTAQGVFAFDLHNVIECKIGKDSKSVNYWGQACQALVPYLKSLSELWQAQEAERVEREEARQRHVEEERAKAVAEEKVRKEKEEEQKKVRAERDAMALDAQKKLELRSIAHQHRQRINDLLKHFNRKETIGEEAVVVDDTAFNAFEQPFAKFAFRLKLIGELYDYEICLNHSDDVLRFSLNTKDVSIEGWADVEKRLTDMLAWAKDSGVDDKDDDGEHTGLCRVGFLQNFDTHLRELANLAGVDRVDTSSLDLMIKKQREEGLTYCDDEMRTCSETHATFQLYETGLKHKDTSQQILARFWRGEDCWFGVQFVTQRIRPAARRRIDKLGVWVGYDETEHRQEQDAVRLIVQQVQQAIENGVLDWCHVLYNFRFRIHNPKTGIRTRQVDLALVIKNCILIMELKHYNNPVRGGRYGKWMTTDAQTGEPIPISAGNPTIANPFEQVRITRSNMQQALSSSSIFKGLKEPFIKRLVSASVVFSDDLKNGLHDNIKIDTSSIYKWFYHGRISEAIEILRRVVPGNAGIETSEKAVRIITNVFGLQEGELAQGVPVARKV